MGSRKLGRSGRPGVVNHQDKEQYLGRYAGLMLYLKEMDEGVYGKLCAVRHSLSPDIRVLIPSQAYFSAASDMHSTQMKSLMNSYLGLVKKASDEDNEQSESFDACPPSRRYSSETRLLRDADQYDFQNGDNTTGWHCHPFPIEGRKDKTKDKAGDGELRASEVRTFCFAITTSN